MDAIITAGGIPQPDEPLYDLTQGRPKALLELEGKPMIQWVVDALDGSSHVENLVIIGLDPESRIITSKPVHYIPNQGSMVDNLKAGLIKVQEINPTAEKVVVASSDIPAITTEMVDWLVDIVQNSDEDVYYCVIPREVMETRYPGSNRTFTHLKDMDVCGGDMNALAVRLVNQNSEIWEKLTEARKSVVKQAALIGFSTLLLVLVRRATIASATKRITKKLGVQGKAVLSPYAEIGMDVDKPHQLEMVRADLAKRRTAAG